MNQLHKEVIEFIGVFYKISEIDNAIEQVNKKNYKIGEYYLIDIILGSIFCMLNITAILYFFHCSYQFIGIHLVNIFFYNNNLLLSIIIIILVAFSSIELSLFMLNYLTFKNARDQFKSKKWNTFYLPYIQSLQLKKQNYINNLTSDIIPKPYINIECLLFFKQNIERYKINNIDKLIELYKIHKIKCRNEKFLRTILDKQKK